MKPEARPWVPHTETRPPTLPRGGERTRRPDVIKGSADAGNQSAFGNESVAVDGVGTGQETVWGCGRCCA